MPQVNSLIGFLDSRSFMTIWYWLALVGLWSATGRTIMGIPSDVVARARAALAAGQGDDPAVLGLLDWLSLVLPRWRLGPTEGAVFLGLTSFGLTSLAMLGFAFWLELAQAMFLLLMPFWVLFWMRVRLARNLVPLVGDAQLGRITPDQAAQKAARMMIWHRRWVTVLSMVSVLATVLWGSAWAIMHPNGL
ncbi:hypothetical protein [Paracoccus sp. R86501]|uniref:hypothetical protein n=1 Tax=Paracoccus sp. R86501 TaxID=3101711 RepID=UPI00366BDDC1